MRKRALVATLGAMVGVCLTGSAAFGYVIATWNGYTVHWKSSTAYFYVNPANQDGLSADAVIGALRYGAGAWSNQSQASFQFVYGGTSNATSISADHINTVIFRNASDTSSGTIATTYTYWDAQGNLYDADMVFWDASFRFFTGTSGCVGGLYIEDTATHEFGHALGLNHSSVSTATMYATASYCGQGPRTLDPDDIAGVETIYPPGGSVTNTAPVVRISSPASNSSFVQGSSILFQGSATDAESGSLSSGLVWSSSLNGKIGAGTSFSTSSLSVGTHTITASVSDPSGLSGSAKITLTVNPQPSPTPSPSASPAPSAISLSAQAVKGKGGSRAVNLSWHGASSASVDLYRNGSKLVTTANDGSYTDALSKGSKGTFSYQICEAGSRLACSSVTNVTF